MITIKEIILREIKHNLKEYVYGSKVVGYHGTDNKFSSFNDNKPIFFVDNIDVAKTFGNKVIKAELTIDNPVVFDFDDGSTFTFLDKHFIPSKLAEYIKEIANDIKQRYQLEDDLRNELEYYGYIDNFGDLDGIVMKDIKDANEMFSSHSAATNYVVFNKSQIKIIK